MKFYNRFPDRALAGMAELSLEQIGVYNLIIDLLYSRDGLVPNNDHAICRMLHLDPRTWRRLKGELIAAGKLHVTTTGMLTANGVDQGRLMAEIRSMSSRHAANLRWENYRKAKGNNDRAMPDGNATKIKNIYSSTSLEAEQADECGKGVGEQSEDNFGVVQPRRKPKPTNPFKASRYLEAVMRAKDRPR